MGVDGMWVTLPTGGLTQHYRRSDAGAPHIRLWRNLYFQFSIIETTPLDTNFRIGWIKEGLKCNNTGDPLTKHFYLNF